MLIGEKQSYVERTDTAFASEVQRYFHQLQILEDALEADDHIVKVGIYSFDGLDPVLPRLESYQDNPFPHVLCGRLGGRSGQERTNKGVALEELQRILGVGADETVVLAIILTILNSWLPERTRSLWPMHIRTSSPPLATWRPAAPNAALFRCFNTF